MLPQAATEFYRLQQAVTLTTRNEVRRLWRRMGDDFDTSWRRVGPEVLAVIAEAQAQMAMRSKGYTTAVLNELDIPDQPEGSLRTDSLVGIASDGRHLDSLAAQSVVTAKVAITEGASTRQALTEGGEWLELMAQLQVADAARVAVGIGAASRRNIGGHVRVLNVPVCQRCAVLGGRFYRWSSGFDRHPRDDCTMLPVRSESFAKSNSVMFDPQAAYKAGQIKDLTQAQIKALEDGADLGRVVNAHRGISTTSTETAKSIRIRLKSQAARPAAPTGQPDLLAFLPPSARANLTDLVIPTPEGIYAAAGSDRSKAIALLREWGYIT